MWLVWATVVAITDVIYQLGAKKTADRFAPFYFITLINLGVLTLSVPAVLLEWRLGYVHLAQWQYALQAFCLGWVVIFAELGICMMYRRNAPFTLATAVIGALIAVLSLLIGRYHLHEVLLWQHYVGLVLAVVGVALMSMERKAL